MSVFALVLVCFAAFGADGRAVAQLGSADQQGTDLGSLLGSLGNGPTPSADGTIPCLYVLSQPADSRGLECLLGAIGVGFQVDEQWDLLARLFATRYANRLSWPLIERGLLAKSEALAPGLADDLGLSVVVVTFEEVSGQSACPRVLDLSPIVPDEKRLRWLETAEGLRDLSPARLTPQSVGNTLVREGLRHENPAEILAMSACGSLRQPLAQALLHSALAFGDLPRAQAIADLAFMPARYSRQMLGARRDAQRQQEILRQAYSLIEMRRAALPEDVEVAQEVATLSAEVTRQFTIDFLIGELWALSADDLRQRDRDPQFVDMIGELLSADARLLRQGYDQDEVRLFHPDFFEVMVAKGTFDTLRALDLLVPEVLRGQLAVALAAEPLSAHSPTRFEQDQEALALLIRVQEVASVLTVWEELSSAQRQDAVLYALDQGAQEVAQSLYEAFDVQDVSIDFLIRFALYYADGLTLDGEEGGSPVEIEIDLDGGGAQ